MKKECCLCHREALEDEDYCEVCFMPEEVYQETIRINEEEKRYRRDVL